jgi:uncharacterized protein
MPDPSALLAALRWLLVSPQVLSQTACAQLGASASIAQFSPPEILAIEQWLGSLARDPAPLLLSVQSARDSVQGKQPGHLRLGRMAERLLAFFLTHGPLHRLVAQNIALRQALNPARIEPAQPVRPEPVEGFAPSQPSNHTTLGEIDFLLHSPSGQNLHWELAVKFFLCQATGPAPAQLSDFVGPDSAETFDHKVAKLLVKQLGHRPPAPWSAQDWQPQAFAKGWMFYRHGQAIPPCAALNPEHCKGWWLPFESWGEVQAANASQANPPRYLEILRPNWMPPASLAAVARAQALTAEPAAQNPEPSPTQSLSAADVPQALQAAWAAQQFPRLGARLVAQIAQQADGSWHEQARYFVQPPNVFKPSNL